MFNLLLYQVRKMQAGDTTLSFPARHAPVHLRVLHTKDPVTSSLTALPCPPPSPGPQPPRHLKNREDLGWKLKKDTENTEEKCISSFVQFLHGKLGRSRHVGELPGRTGWEEPRGAVLAAPGWQRCLWAGDRGSSRRPCGKWVLWNRTSLWPSATRERLRVRESQRWPSLHK